MVFQHWRAWLATRGILLRLLLPAPEQTSPLAAELEQLLLELEQAQQEAERYSRLYAEAQGDLARMKGRLEQAREKYTRQGQQALLPMFDGLWRAFLERPNDLAGHQWVKGMDLVARQLTGSLRKLGVLYAYGEVGQPFHPQWHEAVAVEVRIDLKEGTIVRVHQQGYVLGESVMRPARHRLGSQEADFSAGAIINRPAPPFSNRNGNARYPLPNILATTPPGRNSGIEPLAALLWFVTPFPLTWSEDWRAASTSTLGLATWAGGTWPASRSGRPRHS